MADQGAEGLLSPFLRKQRILAAKPYLRGWVLDVGCGSGRLAAYVEPPFYVGVDVDEKSLVIALRDFPDHEFRHDLPDVPEQFDTVVALAVIEHVADRRNFLHSLRRLLRSTADARVVCTTPHPTMNIVHWIGSRIGLFSRSANDEHGDLLDRSALAVLANGAGLGMVSYGRFLFGANQIAVFRRDRRTC